MATTSRIERRAQRKDDREKIIAEQRARFRLRERNKKIFNWSILAIVIIAAAYAIYVSTLPEPALYDSLAKCLTRKGVVMYGSETCPHCQDQKRLFGKSFRYVTFVNCELDAAAQDACKIAGVVGYPTWTFPVGPKSEGLQALSALADRTECPLQ